MSDQYNVRLGPGLYRVSTVQDPLAESAYKVYTQKKNSGSLTYLTFVESNNDVPTKQFLYTNEGVTYNPISSTLSAYNVTVQNNLVVENSLVVQGSYINNPPELAIENRTIDLGLLNGGVGVATNTTWDLGVIFNYNENDTRKKTALVWEYTTKRFQFSNDFSVAIGATTYDSPQISVNTFAPIEVSSLWINNACTSGPKEIFACVNGELRLQNVVIDEGEY